MTRRIKRTYRQMLGDIFYRIKTHGWYIRIMTLPLWIRITLSIFLFLFGIFALLTPVPAGWMMILASGVLVLGLRVMKRHSVRLFFMLRLHRVIEWVKYKWKK